MNIPGFSTRKKGPWARGKAVLSRAVQSLPWTRRASKRAQRHRRWGRVGSGLVSTAAAFAAYRYVFQPWHRTWGATEDEVQKSLPGDGLVPNPSYETTRAVTIEAPPERIWPWLVQMGQGRGGFYSYEWLENLFGLDIHNTDHIVGEWQDLQPGDTVRLAPVDEFDGRAQMRVVHLEPNRALVFGPVVDTPEDMEDASRTGAGTWAFVLEPLSEDETRLIVRTRSRPWQAPKAVFYLYDPAHFVMERKMMIGLKRRVEGAPPRSASPPTNEEEPVPEAA